jgi:hypothetical protein
MFQRWNKGMGVGEHSEVKEDIEREMIFNLS